MAKYKICDLVIEMEPGLITKNNAKKYRAEIMQVPDISIDSSLEYARREMRKSLTDDACIYLNEAKDFYRKLLFFNGTFIHSSAVVVDEKAYLFSAPCGTGKSTHTSKWLELFGEKAYIINDDKPAIRILDSGIYTYGTPWSGKHDISSNTKVKLQGICFLSRDSYNHISKMNPFTAFQELIYSSLKKINKQEMERQLEILSEIVARIPIYEMGCTPTVEAAKVAYEAMSKAEVI